MKTFFKKITGLAVIGLMAITLIGAANTALAQNNPLQNKFIDHDYQFSLLFPNNWVVDQSPNNNDYFSFEDRNPPFDGINLVNQFLISPLGTLALSGDDAYLKTEEILVGGKKAIKQTWDEPNSTRVNIKVIEALPHLWGKDNAITYIVPNGLNDSKDRIKMMEEMIQSFEFLN